MMTGFNLPPGCSVTDIPGNRPQDEAWEVAVNWMADAIQQVVFRIEEEMGHEWDTREIIDAAMEEVR
jgi:hypothetical protein